MSIDSSVNVMAEIENHPGMFLFMCPGCKSAHQIKTAEGDKPRWTFNGDMVKPTIRASILVHKHDGGQPRCHSFVTDGNIQFLGDCTHDLNGQTVSLPVWGWNIYDDDAH